MRGRTGIPPSCLVLSHISVHTDGYGLPRDLLALLYARKSSYRGKRLRAGRSIAEQLAEEEAWCDRERAIIVDRYVDDDRSASRFATKEREEFERLIADIEARRGNIVVAWESSRLQRDLAVYVRLRDACWKAGVLWCINGRVYDLSNREDRQATAYDAIRDEDDAEAISERVQRTLRFNALDGRPHRTPLYGYRRVYDERGHLERVEIDEAQADIVREIVTSIAKATGVLTLTRSLNDRGVPSPTGGQWTRATIRTIATNPAYVGKRVHRGEVIGGAIWPTLFETNEDAFHAAGAILRDPARRTQRDSAVKHLLSGLARCRVCTGPTWAGRHPRGHFRYVCEASGHFGLRKDPIDDYIEGLLIAALAAPDAAEFFAVKRDDSRLAEERAQIARWKTELEEGEELVETGEMTVHRLAKLEQRLLPKIEASEAKIRQAVVNPLLVSLIRTDPEEVWMEWQALEMGRSGP
ncbi:recombinase family protein [Planotetraspora sp. GP83]|uniref:recombinase family protein n=1 Tax=Planotetraspora sp. GP83 TaxID=3156264 RepID=UPI003513E515